MGCEHVHVDLFGTACCLCLCTPVCMCACMCVRVRVYTCVCYGPGCVVCGGRQGCARSSHVPNQGTSYTCTSSLPPPPHQAAPLPPARSTTTTTTTVPTSTHQITSTPSAREQPQTEDHTVHLRAPLLEEGSMSVLPRSSISTGIS
jgi:hypothetical protein